MIIPAPNATAACTEVRWFKPEDRASLLAMYETFEPRGGSLGLPPRDDTEHWLDSLASYANLLVFADGRLAGHGVLCPEPSNASAEIAVFVHQDFRGQRLGTKLLTRLVDEARAMGLRRVWGMTEPDNLPMLRLAASLGFVHGSDPYEFTLDLKSNPSVTCSESTKRCNFCDPA
jgi:RimJ/RimL family protein N-acetyltransferase